MDVAVKAVDVNQLAADAISVRLLEIADRWASLARLTEEYSADMLVGYEFNLRDECDEILACVKVNIPSFWTMFPFGENGLTFVEIAGYSAVCFEDDEDLDDVEQDGEIVRPLRMVLRPGLIDEIIPGVFSPIFLRENTFREVYSRDNPTALSKVFGQYQMTCSSLAKWIVRIHSSHAEHALHPTVSAVVNIDSTASHRNAQSGEKQKSNEELLAQWNRYSPAERRTLELYAADNKKNKPVNIDKAILRDLSKPQRWTGYTKLDSGRKIEHQKTQPKPWETNDASNTIRAAKDFGILINSRGKWALASIIAKTEQNRNESTDESTDVFRKSDAR